MKEFKKEGFSLYEAADAANLPEKFTRAANGRLTVGESYKILGFCSVPESTRKDGTLIKAWDGVALENISTEKKFPVGLATIQGIGFQKNGEAYKIQTVSKQLFEDALAVQKHFKKSIRVDAIEVLQVTPFGQDGTVEAKNFYLFSKA